MEVSVGDVVMPGDRVKDIVPTNEKETIVLGPGLRREADLVFACKAGILKKRNPAIYYVDSYQKRLVINEINVEELIALAGYLVNRTSFVNKWLHRYVPSRGENVIGIVTQKAGDIFRVDIGASEQASLSYLAFEGATKKNRPDLHVGDAVFAKLLVASKDMEPELICVDSQGKEKKLGVLSSEGMIFGCSLSLVRKILNPDYPLFKMLASNQAYELAAGMNGKIWVKAKTVQETIAVANAILAAEYTPPSEIHKLHARISRALLLSA